MSETSLKALKLITEESVNIRLVESVDEKNTKTLFLEGVYSTHSVENKNGRRYKQKLLEREINKLAPVIKEHKLFGELNHPSRSNVDLNEACILIEGVNWADADLMGKSSILESPKGHIVSACLKRGIVGISSRGLGTVGNDGWVNDDFQLLTWDVVSDPSNQKSWVKGICESKIYYVNESGIVVREESVLTENQKKEAIADAISDSKEKIEEMANAVVQERLNKAEELLRDAQAEIIRLKPAETLVRESLEEIHRLRKKCGEEPDSAITNSVTEGEAKRVYVSILKESLRKRLGELL